MLKLVIGNKLYSSWSLRPWLVIKHFDIPFEDVVIPLREADTQQRLAVYSPSGKVPVLVDGETVIWESLAIIEYLAESFPDRAIWPRDKAARARARAIANEMHGGFVALRQACPMHLGARFATPEMTQSLKANIDRVLSIWTETRRKFGSGGPYLFGAFTAADAMYLPVVTRFDTFQIPVEGEARAYMDASLKHPAFVAWREAAHEETWRIADYAAGHTLVENII